MVEKGAGPYFFPNQPRQPTKVSASFFSPYLVEQGGGTSFFFVLTVKSIIMKLSPGLRSILYSSEKYWWWRSRWRVFHQSGHIYAINWRDSFSRYHYSARVFLQVLRAIVTILLLSFGLVLICELAESYVFAALDYVATYLGFDHLRIINSPSGEFVISYVCTIAQISGIFLGLYYAAVGVVASTAYSQLPHQLRLLLIRERIGNLYILLTTVLATVALIILSLRSIGYEAGRLSLVVVSLLSIFSVASFVRFGQHVFNLFDLITVLEEPYQNILGAIKRVTSVHKGSGDSVHELSRHQTKKALQAFADVILV